MIGGLLLTGGASRRLGFDKAELRLGGERLADRAARVLRDVCDPVFEVGPGHSSLPVVHEPSPGEGPLVALVAGGDALRAAGTEGSPLLLLAVDLPFVEPPLLAWLASHPADGSVVPTDAAGEPQPCCARYHVDALAAAVDLVATGKRSLRALLEAIPVELVGPDQWRQVGEPNALDDADTPEDVARLGLTAPG